MTRHQRACVLAKSWWNQPDQFDWITGFLSERGRLRSARMILATVAGSAGLVPPTLLLGQHQPSPGLLFSEVVGGALTIGMAILWGLRWPTRRQSKCAAVLGLACIAVWSQTQSSAAQAAQICMATAITGGYLAFLHTNKLMAANLLVAVAIDVATTLRMARDTGAGTAIGSFWLIWFINLSVPLAIRGMSRTIRLYATRAREDPLTGLLNRAAFADAVAGLVASSASGGSRLVVIMVDLDDFKRVNDTHGHAAGDRTLHAVAQVLRHHADGDAMLCRAGGEEFLIAVASGGDIDTEASAARLCTAIAALPHGVTASVGTASTPLPPLDTDDSVTVVERLITRADEAMYMAKRAGGNHAHHL